MAKPIQKIIQEFVEIYGKDLIFVKEYGTFYLRNDQYGYYESAFKTKDDVFRFFSWWLESNIDTSITKGIFENAYVWLKNKCKQFEEFNSSQILFNDSKVLNLHDLKITDHNPNDVIFYFLDCHAPQDTDDCPVFKKFLNEVLVCDFDGSSYPPDPELINFVQEMFGYYLIDKIEPPSAFFLIGDGANGKSTLLSVLEQLAGGKKFIMSNSVENLTTSRFDAAQLRFNRLNICTEEQSKYLRADRFKAIVEGSRIHADIKFGDPISFEPKTKHVFATNRIPLFDTIDYGLERRIKVVPFKRKFLAHQTDKSLKADKFKNSKFANELSGIVKWALEGAKRLIESNYTFPTCAAVEKEMDVYKNSVSSAAMFINENFEKINDPDSSFISDIRLFRLYSEWCQNNNKKPFASNTFQAELKHLKVESIVGRDKYYHSQVTCRGRRLEISKTSEMSESFYYMV
jgi:P4 family phage/plasmid primase-like protien